jgi:hypothetical protein
MYEDSSDAATQNSLKKKKIYMRKSVTRHAFQGRKMGKKIVVMTINVAAAV